MSERAIIAGDLDIKVGDNVVFVDEHSKEHNAIVICAFSAPHIKYPSVNVVHVSDDESKSDSYGRQIERRTSVPHQSNQPAHGMYWR